jgi:hypothetical protein
MDDVLEERRTLLIVFGVSRRMFNLFVLRCFPYIKPSTLRFYLGPVFFYIACSSVCAQLFEFGVGQSWIASRNLRKIVATAGSPAYVFPELTSRLSRESLHWQVMGVQ